MIWPAKLSYYGRIPEYWKRDEKQQTIRIKPSSRVKSPTFWRVYTDSSRSFVAVHMDAQQLHDFHHHPFYLALDFTKPNSWPESWVSMQNDQKQSNFASVTQKKNYKCQVWEEDHKDFLEV